MILIVGWTGYIGRYLSVYLKEKGDDIEVWRDNSIKRDHI